MAVVAALVLGLAACGSDGGDAADRPTSAVSEATEAETSPDAESTESEADPSDVADGEDESQTLPTAPSGPVRYPSCDQIRAALGPEVADLIVLPDTPNGFFDDGDQKGVRCGWHTPGTGKTETFDSGGVAVSVTTMVDDPYVEADMRAGGFVVEDSRARAVDTWIFAVQGDEFELSDQLNGLGVQLVKGDTAVIIGATSLALGDAPGLADLTNDWAIGAGARIWELTD